MLDQLFMADLARDLADPIDPNLPTGQQATVSVSSPVMTPTDTAGGAYVGTRLNTLKAGDAQPTQQDREKMAIGLLDTLAGALRGAVIEGIALPGNARSILDMINKEGAEKYLGAVVAPTTEDIKKAEGFTLFGQDISIPPVLGADVPNRAERQKAVDAAENVGAFLPAPGIPEAVMQGAKLVGKAVKATKGLPVGMSIKDVTTKDFSTAIKKQFDGLELDLYDSSNSNKLVLSKIALPKDNRKSGIGTKVMSEITNFADSKGKIIALTPATDFGATSVSRLKDFYKRFGFVENKGKNKDFSISESMYRLPSKKDNK